MRTLVIVEVEVFLQGREQFEAGGKISDFAGGPYHPGDHVILSSNGLIHKEMEALAVDIAERTAKT